MMSLVKKGLYGFVLFVLMSGATTAFAWPSFPHAPGIELVWQTDKMVYNGLPMKVENFKCECSMEDIQEFYRKRWGRKEQGYIENNLGVFQQIVRAERKYFFSVMVKPDPQNFEYAVGRLVISPIPDKEQERYVLGEGVPTKGGATVISDVHDAVPGKRSRTVLMLSGLSVQENTAYYNNYYVSRGWKPYLRPMADGMGVQALSFSHKKKDANIVITDVGLKSSILFNEVTDTFR